MFPLRDDVRPRTYPLLNNLLIAANAAVFLRELSLGPGLEPFILRWGLVPSDFRPAPLFTSMFLHGGWLHIIANMWTLYIFGHAVEDRLGHLRYLAFYVATGVAAASLHLLVNWGSPLPVIGASGAIAGVMGAYLVLFPFARIETLVPVFFFFYRVQVPAFFYLGLWFLTQLFSGTASLGSRFGEIAWWAHVGGFLAGAALARPYRRRTRRDVYFAAR